MPQTTEHIEYRTKYSRMSEEEKNKKAREKNIEWKKTHKELRYEYLQKHCDV